MDLRRASPRFSKRPPLGPSPRGSGGRVRALGSRTPDAPRPFALSRRINVRWLCLRPPDQLEPYELDALRDILDGDERLALGYALLQRFRRVIARRMCATSMMVDGCRSQRSSSLCQPLAWDSGGSRRGRQRIDAALVNRASGRHRDRGQTPEEARLRPRLHSPPAPPRHQRRVTHPAGAHADWPNRRVHRMNCGRVHSALSKPST